ncbi:MAG: hypothetical protein GWO24_10970, partial [Akkermansiaceae bacterium]|nr:hypothetical protein [Akkermansiaceae bacterium]
MPGRIIAMFSGSIAVDKKATSPNLAMTLVIRPAGEPRGIGYAYVRIPNTAGEGLWEMPVSFMGFDDVDGGAMTYNVTAFVPEES